MEKFNRLTVLLLFCRRANPDARIRKFARCQCECGKMVDIVYSDVKTGHTKSCGCHKTEVLKIRSELSFKYRSERRSWAAMKRRCYEKSSDSYHLYGGRGIKVCDRWINSFRNFLEDLGAKPSKNHSIERKNNDGDYEPSNCIWATPIEQANNRRTSRLITYNGQTKSLSSWCTELGLDCRRVRKRIALGWNIKDAFLIKPRPRAKIAFLA